ncbi:MAG: SAM-dependent methyltransferase, partial [Acidimicrobiales bacterium]|nr:SAM-dependent methyltransferase [Acidimicrobiales bacterium]
IRIQDYRDIGDGPFDAISSIGMAEHVGGAKELRTYFGQVAGLLKPDGRFLNHAISQAATFEGQGKNGFIQRFVFPDGELHEIGESITAMQEAGLEARHMETFRLHYARTLRHWVNNLENNWDDAIAEVGRGRAWVWRLYMAGCAVAFERGQIQLNQVVAVHEGRGHGDLPLRQDW